MKVLQADGKRSKAEDDSAIERLRTNMETLRTDVERGLNRQLIVLVVIGLAVIGLLVKGS